MSSDVQQRRRTMRADARKNYEKLLSAAIVAFNEHGAQASLDDIARQAGVGSATLYRHFPTRQDLLETVLSDRVDALCAQARDLLDEPSPITALRAWLFAVIEHSSTYRGLAAAQLALQLDDAQESATSRHDQVRQAGRGLLVRAQDAGLVREGIDITDLLMLVNAIAWATEQTTTAPGKVLRLLEIVLEGIVTPAVHS